MPNIFRESQDFWFNKTGMSCHGIVLLWPRADVDVSHNVLDTASNVKQSLRSNAFNVHYLLQIVDHEVKQSGQLVYALLEDALMFVKRHPEQFGAVDEVVFQTDNAKHYANKFLLSMMPTLGKVTGIRVVKLLHNEPGLGKTLLDSFFGIVTLKMKRHVDSGGSTVGAYRAAESLVGLRNTTTHVVGWNTKDLWIGDGQAEALTPPEVMYAKFKDRRSRGGFGSMGSAFKGLMVVREWVWELDEKDDMVVLRGLNHSVPGAEAAINVKSSHKIMKEWNVYVDECLSALGGGDGEMRPLSRIRVLWERTLFNDQVLYDEQGQRRATVNSSCPVCEKRFKNVAACLRHHNPNGGPQCRAKRKRRTNDKMDLCSFAKTVARDEILGRWTIKEDGSVRIAQVPDDAKHAMDQEEYKRVFAAKWADHTSNLVLSERLKQFLMKQLVDGFHTYRRFRTHLAMETVYTSVDEHGLPLFSVAELPSTSTIKATLTRMEGSKEYKELCKKIDFDDDGGDERDGYDDAGAADQEDDDSIDEARVREDAKAIVEALSSLALNHSQ
eukprot:TRINITY_DN64580_c0_g1_i2.p2 TRINITY_DN64580_c0_g1~~TRINITY_DN64580_c0_g1_i2.p2  ORF type:complete len:554 (+),score=234.09 TRINITY_DN64580_c0_g1_i2:2081-3742(+)